MTEEEQDAFGSYDLAIKEMRKRHLEGKDVEHLPHFRTTCDVAIKADTHKPKFDLLPWDALSEIAKVYEFGKNKYSARNWEKGFDWLRLWNAAMRHLTAWERGEDKDPETNLSHTVHAAFCVLALVAHETRNIGKDDRYK